MAEDAGDAPEQVDVDILFPEYLVNIGACAAVAGIAFAVYHFFAPD